jgi:hypothetical protein
MGTRKTTHQLWHVSRGIVFAGGASVVYPRLPSVRYQSAPATLASAEPEVPLPTVLSAPNAPDEPFIAQWAENAQAGVAASPTTARATVSAAISTASTTASTAAVMAEGVAEENKGAVAETTEELKAEDTGPELPPHTPLDFKMPDEVFQEAKKAAEGTPESFWTYTMYRGPGEDGALDAKVKVHYCTSSSTTERVIKQYFTKEKVLGLDLEWMANALKSWGPRKNVSLIQLASPSRIGLFHIAAYPVKDKLVAPSLKKLLEDPEITKVGVSIKGDCKRLVDFLDIKTRGQFELSHLYKLVKYSKTGEHKLVNKKLVALSTQVNEALGLPLFKGSDVRTSDWTKPLNMNQIICKQFAVYLPRLD